MLLLCSVTAGGWQIVPTSFKVSLSFSRSHEKHISSFSHLIFVAPTLLACLPNLRPKTLMKAIRTAIRGAFDKSNEARAAMDVKFHFSRATRHTMVSTACILLDSDDPSSSIQW